MHSYTLIHMRLMYILIWLKAYLIALREIESEDLFLVSIQRAFAAPN